MKFNEKTNEITLSSGRTFYAYGGNLSPQIEDIGISLLYGSDGGLSCEDWTPEERREVAEHMIAEWRKWGGLEK